ncbi:hypothetical protein [Streptomyces sp. NPDC059378]|uniref:hypothetical protein n=1 Tax=Streptomyces sp. NPDC059378 TaxID=3346815 RepID=UPI0036852620
MRAFGWSGDNSALRKVLLPTRTKRSPATALLIEVVLLVTAVAMGVLGAEDVLEALTYAGSITGIILLAVAVTTLVGAVAVWDHWFRNRIPYAGVIALIGTIAAFTTNVTLLLFTFKDMDRPAFRVLWCLITAACAWASYAVWRTLAEIPAPRRVAATVILASAVTLANFGYDRVYQPNHQGARPVIEVATRTPVLTKDGTAFAVPVDIKIKNASDVGFYVLGTEFHAMGERARISPKDRRRQQWRGDAEQWRAFQEEAHPLSRREIQQPGELVAAQPWMRVGNYIEAGDTFVTQTVVQLPTRTQYDKLALYASGTFARKDRLRLDQFVLKGYSWDGKTRVARWVQEMKQQPTVDYVVYEGRLYEGNSIAQHTRYPRYVHVYWQFGVHGAQLMQTIRREGDEDRGGTSEDDETNRRYGIVDAVTGPMERTLWDIKRQ